MPHKESYKMPCPSSKKLISEEGHEFIACKREYTPDEHGNYIPHSYCEWNQPWKDCPRIHRKDIKPQT